MDELLESQVKSCVAPVVEEVLATTALKVWANKLSFQFLVDIYGESVIPTYFTP
jgi:hypothetical protein